MPESINKLQPDRDLACYFEQPSAIAAISGATPTGFNVSGSWRQQFDWAVIEWNRDNTFEHPLLRNLPDGDLSGITLSYQESRANCISMDSNLYPTVDWPYLRVWVDNNGVDEFHRVKLLPLATPLGQYQAASATFELSGSLTPGDLIELAWDPYSSEHYNYVVQDGDTPASAINQLAYAINSAPSQTAVASANGASITLTQTNPTLGTNANRIGAYGTVSGAGTEVWQPESQQFSGGQSPSAWQISIPFNALVDADTGKPFATTSVRKLRWTYAADLQPASYARTEFQVSIQNWTVAGNNLIYSVAGPGSRRIEDDSNTISYSGNWSPSSANIGNFSGGSIAVATVQGNQTLPGLSLSYTERAAHQLYLGTRRAPSCGIVKVSIDGATPIPIECNLSEDELVRIPLGTFGAGTHTISIEVQSASFYFDFLEIAYPSQTLPDPPPIANVTLATDWDTYHSSALPAERTAWLISKLGFMGRANHYQGALWFFEMFREGQVYANVSVTFGGVSTISVQSSITLGTSPNSTTWTHLHLTGDTPATVATVFALQINNGTTGFWAAASGNVLTITARVMGAAGNGTAIAVSVKQTSASSFTASVSSNQTVGGISGTASGVNYQDTVSNIGWRTDLSALPLLNRAARDWSGAFFKALAGYGIKATSAFSTELQYVDPTPAAGMAQRYYKGSPCVLSTPAIQTNFSPSSLAFWQECHLEVAQIMASNGQTPYLQFGEVQWWYFPNTNASDPGMPFYDTYTEQQFQTQYGRPIDYIASNSANPAQYPQLAALLPSLIGQFTASIMAHVRQTLPQTEFEVLYPPDTNDFAFTSVVNLPTQSWTPATLTCFKTENFTFTGNRNLNQAQQSVSLPGGLSFPPSQSSHLVGVSDYTTPWANEAGLAVSAGDESVVLFALDQFCLIGYPPNFYPGIIRAGFMA